MEKHYDILILGCGKFDWAKKLKKAIVNILKDSDIGVKKIQFRFSPDRYENKWDRKLPVVVACFSSPSPEELELIKFLSNHRVPVIPIAQADESFVDFPVEIKHLNGTIVEKTKEPYLSVSTSILEAIGLLREQRRLFISYRRTEARGVAVQLHDNLSGKGFDVFLDTHAIRPGKVFQDKLWHELCDSDVVIMLDTPGYFDSKWTREEFGKAQSFGIHLLRLVWPGHIPEVQADLSETIRLDKDDIFHENLTDKRLAEVLGCIERIRARSISDRFLSLTGKLKTEVQAIGAQVIGSGAYRALTVKLSDGTLNWIYPVIGVPTAPLMNSIALKAIAAKQAGPFLVYDHVGITEPWLEHLGWLDKHIPEVDFMRVTEAASKLSTRSCS